MINGIVYTKYNTATSSNLESLITETKTYVLHMGEHTLDQYNWQDENIHVHEIQFSDLAQIGQIHGIKH